MRHRLGLTTRTQISVCQSPFLLQAPQCPCSVWKRLSRDHCCRGRSKPGCRIVGSHTKWELTTWADFQFITDRDWLWQQQVLAATIYFVHSVTQKPKPEPKQFFWGLRTGNLGCVLLCVFQTWHPGLETVLFISYRVGSLTKKNRNWKWILLQKIRIVQQGVCTAYLQNVVNHCHNVLNCLISGNVRHQIKECSCTLSIQANQWHS